MIINLISYFLKNQFFKNDVQIYLNRQDHIFHIFILCIQKSFLRIKQLFEEKTCKKRQKNKKKQIINSKVVNDDQNFHISQAKLNQKSQESNQKQKINFITSKLIKRKFIDFYQNKKYPKREQNSVKKMLDDSIYRQFKSMPFQERLERSQQSVELRQTLLIDEIFKCGKDIFGYGENQYENTDQGTLRKNDSNGSLKRSTPRKRYIYEQDYGRNKAYRTQNSALDDYSADQISFTLSNQDNPRSSSKENYISPNEGSYFHKGPNTHISWKDKLIQDHTNLRDQDHTRQYLSEFIQNQLKMQSSSHEKVGKWKKPINSKINVIKQVLKQKSKQSSPQKIQNQSPIKIKESLYKKTFDLSNSKLNYFPDSAKKRKSIFQKSNKKVNPYQENLNYSSYRPQQKNPAYHTPQKDVFKKLQIPLSEQITKNVYGKLKDEVSGNSFIKQFESQQKKTQQQSEMIWKGFINRSDQWMEKKKSHLIEIHAMQKYHPNYSSTKSKGHYSPNKQHYSYVDMKNKQKSFNNNNGMKIQQKKFQPEYTFRNKKQEPNSKSPKKKESSVQNCINKLKTQTELLKVKLLSPLKNQIEDNHMMNYYKELNQSQSKKLVRKFSSRQDNQFNKLLREHSGFSQLKYIYGNCIGDQKIRQIKKN